MTLLVTGGAGYIGGKLVERLLAGGEKVRVLDLRAESASRLASKGVELISGDILDRKAVRTALDGCRGLFHAAALFDMWQRDRGAYYEINVEGTRNVLEVAFEVGIERAVHTSSAVTIGEAQSELGREVTAHRGYFLSDYERSKCLGEQIALEMAQRGLPLVCVNPTTVYGPGQTKHMTGALVRFLNGRLPAVVDARLNFVYIEDVVEGHLLAMEEGAVGQRYILGGENASLVQFLSLAAEIAGVKREPRTVPGWLLKVSAGVMGAISRLTGRRPAVSPAEARTALHSFIFDTAKAGTELGTENTPLREGLRKTVEWLREEKLIESRK